MGGAAHMSRAGICYHNDGLREGEMDDAGKLAGLLRERFRPWGLEIPEVDVRARGRGRLVGRGRVIWHHFGRDERGEYLDFYASHRMTENLHARPYADGTERGLPAIEGMRLTSPSPEEDTRLEAEHV